MTQTQLVKALAAHGRSQQQGGARDPGSPGHHGNREVKKNGVFVLPGIGRLVRQDRKARMGATRQPAKPSRFRPRRS
jgi:DNA-binding protein HU-beta